MASARLFFVARDAAWSAAASAGRKRRANLVWATRISWRLRQGADPEILYRSMVRGC
jgi:hypothetical protein